MKINNHKLKLKKLKSIKIIPKYPIHFKNSPFILNKIKSLMKSKTLKKNNQKLSKPGKLYLKKKKKPIKKNMKKKSNNKASMKLIALKRKTNNKLFKMILNKILPKKAIKKKNENFKFFFYL
jgi:hypothetical protein